MVDTKCEKRKDNITQLKQYIYINRECVDVIKY